MKKGPNLNLSIDSILQQLSGIREFIVKYRVVIFIVASLSVYSYLVYTIGSLINISPSQAQVDEQLKTTSRLKIDQDAVSKIEQLQGQNVAVQSLFKAARDNPFQE